jgi:hypothetical protein
MSLLEWGIGSESGSTRRGSGGKGRKRSSAREDGDAAALRASRVGTPPRVPRGRGSGVRGIRRLEGEAWEAGADRARVRKGERRLPRGDAERVRGGRTGRAVRQPGGQGSRSRSRRRCIAT